jgi:hypothetical protein
MPVDAPGNDAPAISPHAVSRMHRGEDDGVAMENSPEFTDQPAVVHDRGYAAEPAVSESSPSGARQTAGRALSDKDPKNGDANPSHGTHKAPEQAPRGLGDGELMEQPDSIAEAQEPGPK